MAQKDIWKLIQRAVDFTQMKSRSAREGDIAGLPNEHVCEHVHLIRELYAVFLPDSRVESWTSL
jgi:hypothetical protein